MLKRIAVLAACLALTQAFGSTRAAVAQEAVGGDSLLSLLVVTASRSVEEFREVTSSMSVITEEEIESAPASELYQILMQKGVKVDRTTGDLATVQIRGFSTDAHGNDLGGHVIMLMNGRRMATGNIALVGLANIERIEIIRGPAAAQYGAAAMGGVINLITKKGTGQPFSAKLAASMGSFDTVDALARFNGSSGNWDFSAGFRYDSRGNYKTGDGEKYENTDFRKYGFSLDTGYTFQELHRIGLNVNYYNVPHAGSPGYFPVTTVANRESYNEKDNLSVALDYAGSTADRSLSWAAYYARGEDHRDYYYPTSPGTDSFYTVKSNAANAQVTYDRGMLALTGGLDFLKYDISSSAAAASAHGSVYQNFAPFLIGKLRLFGDRVILSAGGRYDTFKFESKDRGETVNKTHFSPSVGVAYLPVEFLKLRAHYSGAFAMPTDSQYGSNFYYYGTHYIGNPDLEPETGDTYEAGFDLMLDHASVGFTYFSSKTKKFISGYTVRPGEYSYRNNDVAYRKGLEFSASVDLGAYMGGSFVLRPSLNVTRFLTSKTRTLPTDRFVAITGVPKTTVSAGLYFSHPGAGTMANLTVNKYGPHVQSLTSTNAAYRKPYSYTVVDFSFQQRIFEIEGRGKLSARIDVNNLADLEYKTVAGASNYSMPGRVITGGLIYEY
jgi:vitamin B12 transporter